MKSQTRAVLNLGASADGGRDFGLAEFPVARFGRRGWAWLFVRRALRELSMAKVISLILVYSFLTLADARQESKNGKEPSPSDTVKKWIDAAAKKDLKAVAELASRATPKRSLKLI